MFARLFDEKLASVRRRSPVGHGPDRIARACLDLNQNLAPVDTSKARQGHSRRAEYPLLFCLAAGEAIEKSVTDHSFYREWATKIVRDELHKAGWRLADLLEKIL